MERLAARILRSPRKLAGLSPRPTPYALSIAAGSRTRRDNRTSLAADRVTQSSPISSLPRRRRWLRAALGLSSVYLLAVVVLVACQNRIAFPGWTYSRWLDPPAKAVVEEAVVRAADGNAIHAWWLPPAGWTPRQGAVIYVHGNGKNVSNCGRTLLRWQKELNTGVLGFDYPGFGKSTGSPNEQSCYAASQAAFDWLVHEKRVAAADIIVLGQSMGGAMAVELAIRQQCRMLITSGAFSSFPEIAQDQFFWMPARYLTRLRFDSVGKMGRVAAPVFITHGAGDHVVPYAHGGQLLAAAREPKRFYSEPGQHHAQPKTPAFFQAVREFLAETGAGSAPD
jgi:fermentation-respiration switch protein FrsA (DUF1100 family)